MPSSQPSQVNLIDKLTSNFEHQIYFTFFRFLFQTSVATTCPFLRALRTLMTPSGRMSGPFPARTHARHISVLELFRSSTSSCRAGTLGIYSFNLICPSIVFLSTLLIHFRFILRNSGVQSLTVRDSSERESCCTRRSVVMLTGLRNLRLGISGLRIVNAELTTCR